MIRNICNNVPENISAFPFFIKIVRVKVFLLLTVIDTSNRLSNYTLKKVQISPEILQEMLTPSANRRL